MGKIVTRSLIVIVFALSLGGCAVIDILDGKYADPTPGDNNPRNNGSGSYGRSSGGQHFH